MLNWRQRFGKQGESTAVRHLKKNGYKILAQNYRNPIGEIDIIARDKKTIVFVEVKARGSAHFGSPKAAVTLKKQQKISLVALQYLKETGQSQAKARFDVVAVQTSVDHPDQDTIEIIKNAFELAFT